jgi:hypothetical protein
MTATTATGSDLAAVRETYQRDGYVLVKGLIEPGEARYMRQELHDLLGRHRAPGTGHGSQPAPWLARKESSSCRECTTCSSTARCSAA